MINDPQDPLAWIENVYSVWKNQQHIYTSASKLFLQNEIFLLITSRIWQNISTSIKTRFKYFFQTIAQAAKFFCSPYPT